MMKGMLKMWTVGASVWFYHSFAQLDALGHFYHFNFMLPTLGLVHDWCERNP